MSVVCPLVSSWPGIYSGPGSKAAACLVIPPKTGASHHDINMTTSDSGRKTDALGLWTEAAGLSSFSPHRKLLCSRSRETWCGGQPGSFPRSTAGISF